MKIVVQLKDPDVFCDAVDEAVNATLMASGLPRDEQKALREVRVEKANKALEPWVEHGEYVTLEFDTEAGTATVMRRP